MNDNRYEKNAKTFRNDAFSEVLQLLNLDVNIYHNAKVCGNWHIDEHGLGATCFHIVTLGEARMRVPELALTPLYQDLSETVLNCGDLVIFPREIPHRIEPPHSLQGDQQHLPFLESSDLEGTGLLCGEVCFQHKGCAFLLDALPPVLIIRHSDDTQWLGALLNMIVTENYQQQAASQSVMNRLSELMFTYALRHYLQEQPAQTGMLAIYSEPRLSMAIQAIHKSPEQNWTLQTLAKVAGLSRTLFAERFKQRCGWTPGQYLIWWRMQLAWSLLSSGDSVSQVAEKVGYQSESAFSRAFSKMFGMSAGKVRREK